MLYCAVYGIVLYCRVLHSVGCIVLHYVVMYCVLCKCVVWCCIVVYSAVKGCFGIFFFAYLSCIVVYCIVMYSTFVLCTVL